MSGRATPVDTARYRNSGHAQYSAVPLHYVGMPEVDAATAAGGPMGRGIILRAVVASDEQFGCRCRNPP